MNGGFYENTVIAIIKRLILAESPDVSEFERMEWFFNIHKDVFPPTHFQFTGIFTKNLGYLFFRIKLRRKSYTQWISRCIAAARERIPGSIDNYVTGVRECSQQRSNLKDNGYIIVMTV
ncbi:hypothetical protein GPY51_11970 [Photorhabdus laumondii subsp. laumondii]|uniref:Uncharacterized protein n=1 Tax=Photorhabdus laumondii subsp. laumondii TaxID=141679 RepID=A0A6L9JSQ8_PHOLM|nr:MULTISPECIES: hypothetical protein [Photorhabdus]AWK41200.1 hypothetical protein A4R40_06605 [Photorhabdus laumondii subsp. laumondii]KTL59564.1 hypothetical protein AA106_16580 [Photorhabdus laumondii subsp. laumondii]KTL62260.1 hypothetical protein AA106_06280 [Photorhabdus laumondii subsp. laumondii]MCC8386182.1 hypothetical protein [Photorhabdus laumondii]MCC8386638.1 hypothetical protein [Photorhabdus laumondii]